MLSKLEIGLDPFRVLHREVLVITLRFDVISDGRTMASVWKKCYGKAEGPRNLTPNGSDSIYSEWRMGAELCHIDVRSVFFLQFG